MLAGLGAFAGGMSSSIEKNRDRAQRQQQLDQQKELNESRLKSEQREAEAYENRKQMSAEWAELMGWRPRQAGGSPVNPDAPSFSAPAEQQTPSAVQLAGPIPQGGLGMMAPGQGPRVADDPAATLHQQPADPGSDMSPDEYVQKQVLTGDAFSNPEMLTKMAQIAAKYGQTDAMMPFIQQARQARESGLPEAIKFMIQGDGAGAAERLRRGGMDVRGDLTLVDKENHIWSGNIGGETRQVKLKDLVVSANPLEYVKAQEAAAERARKAEMDEKEYKLKERETTAREREATARVGLAGARAQREARTGLGGEEREDRPGDINAALKRQDDYIKRISSTEGPDGKPVEDPDKRDQYHAAANEYMGFLEEALDRRLSANEIQTFTDHLRTYPLRSGDAEKDRAAQARWHNSLVRRFGGRGRGGPAGGRSGREAGNIDLDNRPVVKNKDGTISTVRSMSFNEDGREVVIPTIRDDGKVMSEDEAVAHYRKTGKFLGKFDTEEEATAFAKDLSAKQGKQYGKGRTDRDRTDKGSGVGLGLPTLEKEEEERLRFRADLMPQLRPLQEERRASNLSARERAALNEKISALLAKAKPTQGLGTSSR